MKLGEGDVSESYSTRERQGKGMEGLEPGYRFKEGLHVGRMRRLES